MLLYIYAICASRLKFYKYVPSEASVFSIKYTECTHHLLFYQNIVNGDEKEKKIHVILHCIVMYRKVFHWGPLSALGIVKLVSWTTINSTIQWLPFTESVLGAANACLFFLLAFLTIYNFLCAISVGPGFVPLQWHPVKESDERFLQYCATCHGYKAPRSHHCRKCGRCVMKMDHHCPWINNCVGHYNHGYFTSFLFFAVCGSIHSCILLIVTVYKVLTSNLYYNRGLVPPVRLSITSFVLCIFSIGMALGVFFALSFLLYIQVKSILRNRTGVEDWIIEKAEERRNLDPTLPTFVYPYDLGWRQNIKQVFNFRKANQTDGITWEVRKGCAEYDLTVEQLEQKELKKLRKKPFKVIKKYSGAIFPLVNGFCTCLRPPCSLENRMALNIDEMILVTRYHKYWMFGEKNSGVDAERPKGWFPKSCVIPVLDYEIYGSHCKSTKKDS